MSTFLWIPYLIVVIAHAQQYTELYYDNMEDIQATGWSTEGGAVQEQESANGACEGGCVSIGGDIGRSFDIYGYSDLVVSVNIGSRSLTDLYHDVNLYYYCDIMSGTDSTIGIRLSRNSESSYKNRNFTVPACDTAKTLNLILDMYGSSASKGYLDEVRIWYGNTYSTEPSPAYGEGVYMYDDMECYRCTGWVTPVHFQSNSFHFDSGSYFSIAGRGASVTRGQINTTATLFAAVQYVVGTDFTLSEYGNSVNFVQVQYNCDNANSFTPIATHFGVTTATQYTVILPCVSANTAIRLYTWSATSYSNSADFDNICVAGWDAATYQWSTDYCPNSIKPDYNSSSIYWYDDFDNQLNQWLVDVPDILTTSIWIDTATSGSVMEGNFVKLSGDNVSMTSRAMNGYKLYYPDIQFDIETECGRDANDEFVIEYACTLPVTNEYGELELTSIYQWHILKTYYGDLEGKNVIISTVCNQTPINQIRFKTIADPSSQIYLDNVYYCESGQCPGDDMVDPESGIIFYDNAVTDTESSWIHPSSTYTYRRRFNNLNDCNDLWIQYDIRKDNFESDDYVELEYKYDASETESYCNDPSGWKNLTRYSGSDFADQKILQLPCAAQFHGSLSIKFTMDKSAMVENFYLCNGRSSCPAREPTNTPTFEPTIDPTQDPTHDPTEDPTADPTKFPSSDPTVAPTKSPITVGADDGLIRKEGINCVSGYRDLPKDHVYYGVVCEQCPGGTAGTYGYCHECGFLQVPNDKRDSCEYYQPWWLWLAETLLGLGVIGIVVWCINRTSEAKSTRRHIRETELANAQPPPPPPVRPTDGYTL